MPNRLVRRSLVVAALSLSVVAGCGATGGSGGQQLVSSGVAPKATSAAFLAQAAETTQAADTQKIAVTMRSDAADGGPSTTVSSTGEIDGANGRAHLSAEIGGVGEDVTLEAVYDGDTVYLKTPFNDTLGGGDKPWVKVASPKLAELAEQFTGGIESEPRAFLSLLEGAGGPVETLGTEELRGVPTRHVAVAIDPAKALDEVPEDRRAKLEDLLGRRGVSLDELPSIPAEAWVDDDGYVRKLTVTFDLSALRKLNPEAGALGTITETVELYDFGEPVDITVPPASEVTDLGDVSELFGPGAGHGD